MNLSFGELIMLIVVCSLALCAFAVIAIAGTIAIMKERRQDRDRDPR